MFCIVALWWLVIIWVAGMPCIKNLDSDELDQRETLVT